MTITPTRSGRRRGTVAWWTASLVAVSLVAASCGSDDDEASPDTTPATTPATEPAPVDTTAPSDTTPAPDTTGVPEDLAASAIFPTLPPPTGEEMVIGLVNSEGTPGLDFPDLREYTQATVDYLNEHGGMGGRPVKLETCIVKGTPETSQACAQELAGKNVELVLVGLDLFPDYPTYTAANIPVIGVLPILPGDYTADALYLTGGNATTVGAMAAAAKEYYKASTVGIVSADNTGANGTEAALTAALDIAGISHITVKGGDNETDAGYQGLVREAAKDNPDLLISLYSDDGCIGTIRGRAALGIDIPVMTTSICSGKTVIDAVGDDALGWSFVGSSTQEDTPELAILQEILAPAIGVEPSEVDSTALGLGGLGVILTMSVAMYANAIAAAGGEVTGESIYTFLGTEDGLEQWPAGTAIDCGAAPTYPTICAFTFPVAEYTEGGKVVTIPGLEAVSALPYLP
jgi:ABC-type branched-subunit amino acid transport system substrate-binding protein